MTPTRQDEMEAAPDESKAKPDRDAEIARQYGLWLDAKAELHPSAIGRRFGVTRQRIHQIWKRMGGKPMILLSREREEKP